MTEAFIAEHAGQAGAAQAARRRRRSRPRPRRPDEPARRGTSLRGRCPLSASRRSRRTPGRTATRSTRFVARDLASELGERGHRGRDRRTLALADARARRRGAPCARGERRRSDGARGARRRRGAAAAARRAGRASLPVDVARTIEELLDSVAVRLRARPRAVRAQRARARRCATRAALNVGTFHAPTERLHLHAGRAPGGRAVLRPPRRAHGGFGRHARADDALVPGAVRASCARARTRRRRARARGRCEIAFVADEERAALRLFLRALRRLP